MSIYFFVIFEVHYTFFRYDVCLEEYMNLSPRLISGTKSEYTEPMRRTKRSESKIKKLDNNLTYSSIQQNIELGVVTPSPFRLQLMGKFHMALSCWAPAF